MGKNIKPGTDNQKPGQYTQVGPRGGLHPELPGATIDSGDRLPPTSKPGYTWTKTK